MGTASRVKRVYVSMFIYIHGYIGGFIIRIIIYDESHGIPIARVGTGMEYCVDADNAIVG